MAPIPREDFTSSAEKGGELAQKSRGFDGWRWLGNDFAVFILFGLGMDGVFQFENPLINERFAVALDLGVIGLLVFEPG